MKKLFRLAILMIAVIATVACKKTAEPGEVAEKYLNHLGKMEIDEAKKYATKETGAQLDIFKSMIGDQKPQTDVKPVTIKDTKINGDKATCTFTNGEEEDTIDLVKDAEGEWKVDWKKENPIGGDAGADALSADTTETATPATEDSKENAQ